MNSPDDEWWDLQAGEYVIGTLSQSERATFAKLVQSDADARRRVVWWEARLAFLDRNVSPIDPPPVVWQKILERLGSHNHGAKTQAPVVDINVNKRRVREQQQSLSFWRGMAAVASAACVVLAITLWLQQTDSHNVSDPQLVVYDGISIVTGSENQPLWVIDASIPEQQLRITAVAPPENQIGKSYELWMVKANDQGVSSMGLLPLETAQSVIVKAPTLGEEGVAFAVSLEPAGGSPEEVPTGPVLYSGPIQRLSSIDSI